MIIEVSLLKINQHESGIQAALLNQLLVCICWGAILLQSCRQTAAAATL